MSQDITPKCQTCGHAAGQSAEVSDLQYNVLIDAIRNALLLCACNGSGILPGGIPCGDFPCINARKLLEQTKTTEETNP